jgi:hypothetical protein
MSTAINGKDSSLTIENCIIWGNSNSVFEVLLTDCACDVRFSCIHRADLWPEAGNIATDPSFVRPYQIYLPDEDNDLTEGDYRLQSPSPCIDAAGPDAPSRDLRGYVRPWGSGADMGAYEYYGHRFIRGDTNADKKVNISDAIFLLRYLFGAGSTPTCLDAADANDDGRVNMSDAMATLQSLFVPSGSPAPVLPFTCEIDLQEDALTCDWYPSCP